MPLDVRHRLDPQMAAALARSDALAVEFGPVAPDDIAMRRAAYAHERALWNAVPVELAATEDRVMQAAGLVTPLRLYHPQDPSPGAALVYLHGGGFLVGSLDTHDRIMRLLARHAGVTVIGVDYALAPETRFPRQLEQIVAAVEQLPARFGLGPERIALAGDSAGAHLALAALSGYAIGAAAYQRLCSCTTAATACATGPRAGSTAGSGTASPKRSSRSTASAT